MRVALNPIISTVGWLLPEIVSGSTIVAIVLSLPTVAPLLLRALTSQDSFLAGSILMILASLTVIGTLASDILLAVTDPAYPLRAQMTIPGTSRDATGRDESRYVATQWQLIGRRFRAHKLAMVGSALLVVLYVTALLGEFFCPLRQLSSLCRLPVRAAAAAAIHRPWQP